MYRLVIFDMDGTLLDTDKIIVSTFVELYKIYKPDVKPDINRFLYFSGPPIMETLKKEFPNQNTMRMFEEYRRISNPLYERYLRVYPYAKKLIIELKSLRINVAIVTSKHHVPAMNALRISRLNDVFEVVVASDDVKKTKPDPEGMILAMKRFNIENKKDVLYIGDNEQDYVSAKNAGIDCMLVTWTPRIIDHDKVHPRYYLDSFKNFFEVIENGKK